MIYFFYFSSVTEYMKYILLFKLIQSLNFKLINLELNSVIVLQNIQCLRYLGEFGEGWR